MGRELVVAVTGGKFDFGPWEQTFYGEMLASIAAESIVSLLYFTVCLSRRDTPKPFSKD
jgi:hypothetical protein